ncbi:hypothetical protein J1605_001865 [Eschrichtius robustus]|uniref:non-specific serine/threonine protein kinase n=1 Tax=Eschrichtius robustus TaxID=9764 RepID=A0AB34I189_ESCRO|nr:hypothetical protein J1605_001865 [Eschrichtius robustus]
MTTDKDTFTKVRCPRHILIGKEVAVKIINKSQQNSSGLQRRSHKVKIMKALGHPNMMKWRRRKHSTLSWSMLAKNLKEKEETVLSGIHHISFYVSTECENLLKKFLTLNSSKGGTF